MTENKTKKIILKSFLSPGDIVMLTAAVRDLKKAHGDDFAVGVKTSCHHIWENNPYIVPLREDYPDVEVIKVEYPLIHKSNVAPYHFVHGYAQFLEEKLGVKIPLTKFSGDIHISDKEKGWISQVEELGYKGPFWIIMAGGKYDFTCKWWHPDRYQEVIDHFKGKITFVQVGEKNHFHTPLKGVIDLVGKTDLRQFIRLVYHSDGVLCPVTSGMHLAAAVPTKPGKPKNRACVVVAGGREPSQWEAYPHHQYLHTNGALSCCDNGGCWKSRCQTVGDGDKKDRAENLCLYPVSVKPKIQLPLFPKADKPVKKLNIPKCMDMVSTEDVCNAIEKYYKGGVLNYMDELP